MKEMLSRCSLEDLAIWYIICTHTLGSDNKNGFLKTGVNLSYLVFCLSLLYVALMLQLKNTGYKCFFTAAVLGYKQYYSAQKCKGKVNGANLLK